MMLKQISVFLENRKGSLYRATKVLGDHDIDLIALSIADTTDFGIMRCIVNKPEEAMRVFLENGFAASTTEVIAVWVPDRSGGLAEVLAILDENQINIEYLYSFVRNDGDKALILFRVDDGARSLQVLEKNGIAFLNAEDIYES